MSEQEEIIKLEGKNAVVRYAERDKCPCQLCDFIPPSDEWCCLVDVCDKYRKNGKEAYFKEVPKPLSEEEHSLRGWAQILATNPDLRAEFDKMCPPQPIQGSIAPEVDLDAEIKWYCKEYYNCEYPLKNCSPVMQHVVEAARHFTEWERKRTLDKVVEWMKKNLTYIHPRKGVETCMVNIPVFLDAMNEENT